VESTSKTSLQLSEVQAEKSVLADLLEEVERQEKLNEEGENQEELGAGDVHDQGDAEWIVNRGQIRVLVFFSYY
jgi:hypothetical protein